MDWFRKNSLVDGDQAPRSSRVAYPADGGFKGPGAARAGWTGDRVGSAVRF
jgi:hypothetical protein